MDYRADKIFAFSQSFADAISHPSEPGRLIEAAAVVLPFQAALCVINRRHRAPVYLCDTYKDEGAKRAVQRYIDSTYLINPVYNAFLGGLDSGLYRMRDLAPDEWDSGLPLDDLKMNPDAAEEIGFLTHGWPARMEELVLVQRISADVMAEISFAQPVSSGGFSESAIQVFQPFLPLFAIALETIAAAAIDKSPHSSSLTFELEAFGSQVLTPRENEVVQLILKGHSGKSICNALGISMPTQKSHRKNAYAKLGISGQPELFSLFLEWKHQREAD